MNNMIALNDEELMDVTGGNIFKDAYKKIKKAAKACKDHPAGAFGTVMATLGYGCTVLVGVGVAAQIVGLDKVLEELDKELT